ncbi:hypothetical protein [Nonomuraea cavernae]|uniref:hypothetical protein n=1 Tax=Nonomuraea cavernae TaxID=2045107 RepID=UPI00166F008B|nr:hypothetical protein [Nonomuraea cavernae]MCA2185185.1 hypothetical protein [Nonomuraea cavernae]
MPTWEGRPLPPPGVPVAGRTCVTVSSAWEVSGAPSWTGAAPREAAVRDDGLPDVPSAADLADVSSTTGVADLSSTRDVADLSLAGRVADVSSAGGVEGVFAVPDGVEGGAPVEEEAVTSGTVGGPPMRRVGRRIAVVTSESATPPSP